MSAKQQISDFLEAEVKEEGSPDEDNNSEMNPLPTMMSVDVPAVTSDEIVNFLISDEIANLPSKPKKPEVVAEQPGQAQADPSRSLAILGYLEIPQGQPASGAGSVHLKQTEGSPYI